MKIKHILIGFIAAIMLSGCGSEFKLANSFLWQSQKTKVAVYFPETAQVTLIQDTDGSYSQVLDSVNQNQFLDILYAAYADALRHYDLDVYIPEDQDAWKNAINNTMKHVRDKKYDIFPEEAILPIVVLWEHDGIRDYWSLGVDGSLWGCHDTDDTEPYTKNYVAPEDAVELVSLLKQTYEFFEISPVRPEQLGEITYAELTVKGKTYTLDDPVKLKYLENTLKKGKRNGATGCPFAGLKLTFADGTAITICIAWDGCGVWHSDGMYFRYGNSDDAKSVFALFGIDLYQLPMSN